MKLDLDEFDLPEEGQLEIICRKTRQVLTSKKGQKEVTPQAYPIALNLESRVTKGPAIISEK